MALTLMTSHGPARRAASYGALPTLQATVPPPAAAPDEVVWVYAITDARLPGQLPGLTGVGGEPVRAVTAAGLSAVVGSVDARSFGEQALGRLLGGIEAIARVGRAHHRVIERAAAAGPVLPLRLATLHPDDSTVRALLASRCAEFGDLLEKFRHRVEWGVRLYGRPPGPDPVRDPETVAEVESAADLIDVALSDIAVAARRQPGEDPQFADRGEWLARSAAYLLDADHTAGFTATARGLTARHPGLRLELNGPWPPYSFVDGLEA